MPSKTDKRSTLETSPAGSETAHISARWVWFICLVQFLVLAGLLYGRWTHASSEARNESKPVSVAPPTSPNLQETYFKGAPGPWGELEYVRINIVSPDDHLPEGVESMPKTRWHFANFTAAQLTEFLKSCPLKPDQLSELLSPLAWSNGDGAIVITPSEKLILGLSPEARRQIYNVLAETPANDYQKWPYTFRQDGFEEWFENSGVSPQNQKLLQSLMYKRGAAICFSDLREVFARVPDQAEQKAIGRALSRRTALLVKLRIRPDSDIAALTAYWSKGGRAKDIGALLESLKHVPGGTTIDVAHLLPSFARARLNTFPKPPLKPDERMPDCYWTAMNFFNNPPDRLYESDEVWRKELAENYTLVKQPSFGDLVFLVRPDGVPYHAAVFIADDVVFTKNGGNHRQPWLLMKMEDMVSRYPTTAPFQLAVFTPKHRND
jgi:hypothetical protein